MTIAEIALAVTLVAGAGWLVRSFDNLRTIDAGFAADRRLVFDVSLLGPNFRDNVAVHAAFTQLLDRLRGLNGVTAVASTFNFPLKGGPENSLFVHLQGDPMDSAHNFNSRQRSVSPGFFAAMGIRQLAGRDFNADDRPGTTAGGDRESHVRAPVPVRQGSRSRYISPPAIPRSIRAMC